MSTRLPFRLTVTAGALFGLLGATAAFGEPGGTLNRSGSTTSGLPTAGPKSAPKDWRQATEATCGMACRYHRANDNLTLQALYLLTKIRKIDAALQETGTATDLANARTALGAFCKSDSEPIDACFDRYKAFQRVALLDIRQTIGKHEDTISRLTTGRKADGTVQGAALAFENGEERTPYLPDVPTLAELERSYLEGKLKPKGRPYSRTEIMKWSESLIVSNPNARYLEFNKTPVVGNPYQDERTSYSLNTEKKDGAERPSVDTRAVQMYRDAEGKIQEFAKDSSKEIDGKRPSTGVSKALKKDDAISYESFTEARSVINSELDADMKRGDRPPSRRKLAGEPKPNPAPSASPSGSPSPVPVVHSPGDSRDVKVTTGTSAKRSPTGTKTYGDDEKVERPPEMKNSRYIKYDIGDMLGDIDASTK